LVRTSRRFTRCQKFGEDPAPGRRRHVHLNEFIDPVELLAGAADELEQRFTGHDDY
jgi:hypothetical protein